LVRCRYYWGAPHQAAGLPASSFLLQRGLAPFKSAVERVVGASPDAAECGLGSGLRRGGRLAHLRLRGGQVDHELLHDQLLQRAVGAEALQPLHQRARGVRLRLRGGACAAYPAATGPVAFSAHTHHATLRSLLHTSRSRATVYVKVGVLLVMNSVRVGVRIRMTPAQSLRGKCSPYGGLHVRTHPPRGHTLAASIDRCER
jgi:hypothetical protein